MARNKAAAQQTPETVEPMPAQELNTPQAAAPAETGQPAAAVNPFPREINTAVLAGGYRIRLMQIGGNTNEMRIQFGSGLPADKPSDAVLDIVRSQTVPEPLMTSREREEGKPVPWFKFRGDPETGEGTWRMWLRNHPLAARTKAEEVFNAVVRQATREIGTDGPVPPR